MAEIRRGFGGDGLGNERLPWLEPVEDEDDYPEGSGNAGRIAVMIVAGLVVAALVFGAFVLWQRHRQATADIGQIIHAPAGPYKVKPANPGGLKVDESGVIAEKMGTGTDINSPLDLSRIPEQPVTGAGASAEPSETPAPPPPAPRAPAPATPPAAPVAKMPSRPATAAAAPTAASAPVVKAAPPAPMAKSAPVPVAPPVPSAPPSAGGGTIQLGALGSEAKAKQVWKALSGRFSFLAPLAMSITPVKVGDNTLYRLRASGGDARRLCAQLKVAGESCNVVN